MDLEEISRENLFLLATEKLKRDILNKYKIELENLYLAAKNGFYHTTIDKSYNKDIYPLLIWLIEKGFLIYCPTGPEEWKICKGKTDERLKLYDMYLIEWR